MNYKINNIVLEFNKLVYVDCTNGSDENDIGDKNVPFQTIKKAMDYLCDNKKYREKSAIILRKGTYDVSSCFKGICHDINESYKEMNISWIAQNGDQGKVIIKSTSGFEPTVIDINLSYKIKMDFYGLVFKNIKKPGMSLNADNYINEYHNCVFENVAIGGRNNKFKDTLTIIENCLFVNTIERNIANRINGYCINCATTNKHLQPLNGNIIKPLYDCKVDSKYRIISNDWENVGVGYNPNGSVSNIGVYGGQFAWEVTEEIKEGKNKKEEIKLEFKINNTCLYFNKYVYIDSINGNDVTGTGEFLNSFKSVKKAMDYLGSNKFYRKDCAIIFKRGFYDITNCLKGISNNLNPEYNNMNVSWIADIGQQGKVFISSGTSFENMLVENNTSYKIKMTFNGLVFKDIPDPGMILNGDNLINTFYNCVFDNICVGGWNGLCKDAQAVVQNCLFVDTTERNPNNRIFGKCINCASTNDHIQPISGEQESVLLNCSLDNNYHIISDGWINSGIGCNPDGSQANIGVYGGKFKWNY